MLSTPALIFRGAISDEDRETAMKILSPLTERLLH
jgi:hypothetical protein